MDSDGTLSDWRRRALDFQESVGACVIGMSGTIRQVTIAIFGRGHLMLEGDVGVGKTTLLRAVARGIGGAYERIEGTIDLMPTDLLYHTYINEQGRPQVDPGPILRHGEALSVFFFNEVNRARPQVHSLLLRVMAERTLTAFNHEYVFPHLQLFADRNRLEREETFEIPSAARDRFMMELNVAAPTDDAERLALMFDPRFHDTDRLLEDVPYGILPYQRITEVAELIQRRITASNALQSYALNLWTATHDPARFGIDLDGADPAHLLLAGASARGMSMMLRAARVAAWLNDRDYLIPEDIRSVFHDTTAHRIFLRPVYELRRVEIVPELMQGILDNVAAP
ncbi:MAG: MoxR family ATPase [Methylotetracoccus sp.]